MLSVVLSLALAPAAGDPLFLCTARSVTIRSRLGVKETYSQQ